MTMDTSEKDVATIKALCRDIGVFVREIAADCANLTPIEVDTVSYERERCAKLAENMASHVDGPAHAVALRIAIGIRAGEPRQTEYERHEQQAAGYAGTYDQYKRDANEQLAADIRAVMSRHFTAHAAHDIENSIETLLKERGL
jgi:hypothetical protein